MKTIFILLTSGFAARNTLQTDIFRTLKQTGLRLVFFIPSGAKKDFENLEEPGKIIFCEYGRPGFWERKLGNLRCLNSFEQAATWKLNTQTIKIKRRIQKRYRPLRYYVYRLVAFLVGLDFISSLLRSVDWLVFPKNWLKDYFERYRPDLVYSTDPLFFDELYFLEYAKKHRVKIVSQILSWDNLTGRGYLPVLPDKIIVWNKIMESQALNLYPCAKEDVFVSGIPQFDIYFKKERSSYNKGDFFQSMGLDPWKKLIVYATASPSLFPEEEQFISFLLNDMKRLRMFESSQILLRLNPRTSEERYKKLFDMEGVIIKTAGKASRAFRDFWNPSLKDMYNLADSIKSADVFITYWSTLGIESAILNIPTITIAIDEGNNSYEQYTHLERYIGSGGTRIANKKEDVIGLIDFYLKNPGADAEGRRKLTAEQACYLDGESGKRIANYIIKICN